MKYETKIKSVPFPQNWKDLASRKHINGARQRWFIQSTNDEWICL